MLKRVAICESRGFAALSGIGRFRAWTRCGSRFKGECAATFGFVVELSSWNKPAPINRQVTAESVRVRPPRCVLVGDSVSDAAALVAVLLCAREKVSARMQPSPPSGESSF